MNELPTTLVLTPADHAALTSAVRHLESPNFAAKLADYAGFNKRKRLSQKRGRYRGIGISCMLEHAGGMPVESRLSSTPSMPRTRMPRSSRLPSR